MNIQPISISKRYSQTKTQQTNSCNKQIQFGSMTETVAISLKKGDLISSDEPLKFFLVRLASKLGAIIRPEGSKKLSFVSLDDLVKNYTKECE